VVKKGSNRSIGWCRNLAGISTSRQHNSQTLQYYDLLLKCAPSVNYVKVHFYHAFDMNRRSLNRAKLKRKSDDMLPPEPSSILKRTTPTTTTTARRVSFSPNNSTSKRISFEYKNHTPSKAIRTHTMKTPQHIARATVEEVYDGLAEKTDLNSAKRRKIPINLKNCANQCIWDGTEDVIWKQ
jgi:hypothetical protein